MSLETSKIKCSLCGAYLFSEDDVVYCPECGAPHHRECYNSIGKCALEDKHGTAEEYKKPENPDNTNENSSEYIKCGMCGHMYDKDLKRCPECGTPDVTRAKIGFNFDFLGGIPADLDLGEGVTADEAKQFVVANTPRYLPKFAANKVGKKASWNWIAFLFPCGWFLSRKMYKWGIIFGALSVAIELLFFPFTTALMGLNPDMSANYTELVKFISNNIAFIGIPAVVTAAVSLVFNLALRIFCGVMGDYIYRNHCLATISAIKSESEDVEYDFRKKGGVSIILFFVGVLAVENLPQIIAMFAGF